MKAQAARLSGAVVVSLILPACSGIPDDSAKLVRKGAAESSAGAVERIDDGKTLAARRKDAGVPKKRVPPQFASIPDAVSFLRGKLDIPVVLPSRLPPGIRLDPKTPLYLDPSSATLNLMFPGASRRGRLLIAYGDARFDGCGGDSAKSVTVHGQRALMSVHGGPWTELIWPVTGQRPQGLYGLYGTFSRNQMLALANSMAEVRVRVGAGKVLGC